MNFLDIIILIPIAYGGFRGFRRGVVKEILMMLAIILGIYVARYFSPVMSAFLISHLGASEHVAAPLSYILVLLLFGGGMYVLAFMLTRILKLAKLGTANRVFGMLLGAFKIALIVSAILCFFAIIDRFIPIKSKPAVQNSLLYQPVENLIGNVIPLIHNDGLINPHECSVETRPASSP